MNAYQLGRYEILAELGRGADAVAALRRDGIVA